ncbi:MAG TPA: M23 family metallopeptidase [Spirochaetales bacterium]|nr:M23 family metallopeptidase [Spirochaetales bacterium]HRY55868.1 M23 family metallopeptidase [Spirochaetia bacterium]
MRSLRPLALILISFAAAGPGAAAAPKAAPSASAAPGEGAQLYHSLKAGETLYSVARLYGLSVESLAQANGISDASKLRAGQKLIIPSAHKVQKGETLYSIAKAYGISVEELRKLNKLSAAAVIRVGELLLVPKRAQDTAELPPAAKPLSPATAAPSPNPPTPLIPDPVRTSLKAVDKKVSWPCAGEVLYLDGKAQGVMIRAKLGEAEKAVAGGKVVAAGPFRGYGQMVIVMSKTGYLYVYAGNEVISAKVGDSVHAGQELGRVGMDAKSGSPIAFFMVYRGREAVDAAEAPRE